MLQLKEKELQLIQLRTKKAEFEISFRDTVRATLEKRLSTSAENRDNLLAGVKAKLREHERRISEVRHNKSTLVVGNSVTVQ